MTRRGRRTWRRGVWSRRRSSSSSEVEACKIRPEVVLGAVEQREDTEELEVEPETRAALAREGEEKLEVVGEGKGGGLKDGGKLREAAPSTARAGGR